MSDPRSKILATLLFILTVGLTPIGHWTTFGMLLLLVLCCAHYSGLGWGYALRRAFVALPFILSALPLPFIVPGPPLLVLHSVGLVASTTGTVRFLSILLRTWLSVQMAILLTATTPFPDLLWGFARLGFPRPLVATVSFMYRYLAVLSDEATRMMRARAARSCSQKGLRKPSVWWHGRTAGLMVGNLLLRTLERSERVYAAMLSRGYDGTQRTLRQFRLTGRDWIALASASAVLVATLALG